MAVDKVAPNYLSINKLSSVDLEPGGEVSSDHSNGGCGVPQAYGEYLGKQVKDIAVDRVFIAAGPIFFSSEFTGLAGLLPES